MSTFNPTDYLINEDSISAFLAEALESKNGREMSEASLIAAHARQELALLSRP